MTPDAIKKAITEGVQAAFADPAIHCRYKIDPNEHALEHAALKRFINVTSRIEDMKWGIWQKLAVAFIMFLAALTAYGAAIKLKLLGG